MDHTNKKGASKAEETVPMETWGLVPGQDGWEPGPRKKEWR